MEEYIMARRSKREYLGTIYKRYRHARRAEKKMILEKFCKICGYNRKYAI
jgi:ribosomal protein L33